MKEDLIFIRLSSTWAVPFSVGITHGREIREGREVLEPSEEAKQ